MALKSGGRSYSTAADREATAKSAMNGVFFHYASLGAESYRMPLRNHRLDVLDEYPDPWDDCVWYALGNGALYVDQRSADKPPGGETGAGCQRAAPGGRDV